MTNSPMSEPESGDGDRSSVTRHSWRQYVRAIGPGLISGACDDDPSGIATYAQAGSQFGLSFLWTALFTFPLIAVVQEICDRTALATGTGLGELALKRFNLTGRWIVGAILSALIVANTLNISADLVAIGSGMNLLRAGPTWIWALLAGIAISVLVVKGSFEHLTQVFKVLAGTLVVYIVVMVSVTHDWLRILQYGVIPHIQLKKSYISLLAALLGTTISPYIFFWQSANRLEEMHEEPEGGSQVEPLKRRSVRQAKFKQRTSRLDVFTGMAFSNIVMFAIIGTTGQTLHAHGITNIQSATQIASALKPVAGSLASVIFALGFIGSGLLAIPVLAASGSIGLSGLLGKEWGFSRKIREAPLFYILVAVGTIGGTALSLLNINPISLLVFVAVINAIISVPLLILVMIISNSRDLMGNYVNGYAANIVCGLTCVVMLVALIALFATGGISV
ncbi:MAG: Nramp family divalent metal transporter [Actinomycetota bacterium]|nr:Nramp family divalent metal transporter [Actinomycetota bacterium]